MFQAIIEMVIVEKTKKQAILTCFVLIWPCRDLEMTLSRPWGYIPVESSRNLFYHVYYWVGFYQM